MSRRYVSKLIGCAMVAVMGAGCAATQVSTHSTHVSTRAASHVASARSTEPLLRSASFHLDCPADSLVLENTIPSHGVATRRVLGCGHQAVLASVNGAWFIASDDLPRSQVVSLAPVVVTPEADEPAPAVRHKPHHARAVSVAHHHGRRAARR